MSFRRRPIRALRHLVEYGLALLVRAIIRLLPHRALFWVAAVGGAVLHALPRTRRVILANLAVAFPEMSEPERRRLARRNATSQMMTFLEFIWFVGRHQALAEKVDFPAACTDAVARCQAAGLPLVWATPHLGNWEVAGLKFRRETGNPFAVVVRPFDNPWLDRMVRAGRESEGTRVIPDKGAVRGVMKAMREGFFLATLIDQNTRIRDGGIFVDFFGLPVPTSRAPALFARKLNAFVAVGGCVRDGRKYRIFVRELPRPTSDYPDDESLIRDLMRLTEQIVREHPEQYLWMYERWRYIPADAPADLAARYPFYATPAPPRFYDGNAPKGDGG
jgi:KDO2-lipid IV(A) lauroyltransferase